MPGRRGCSRARRRECGQGDFSHCGWIVGQGCTALVGVALAAATGIPDDRAVQRALRRAARLRREAEIEEELNAETEARLWQAHADELAESIRAEEQTRAREDAAEAAAYRPPGFLARIGMRFFWAS